MSSSPAPFPGARVLAARPADRDSAIGSARGLLILVLVAVLVMAPELGIGLTVTDNYRFNLLWPEQFTEQVRNAHLYPRWLPRSWDGMGSPVFYFYPPLIFWVTSLIDAASGASLSSERLVPIASLVILIVSGLTMRAWLRTRVEEPRALMGAIAYMLAPYHLYDLYGRGALAEASAYASVPLIMLGLLRLSEERSRFLPVLAIAFAALLFSHLPSALLVGLFLVAPYVAFTLLRTGKPMHFLLLALAGGIIGALLATVFVLPALALLPYASPGALSGSFYRPENWFFWHIRSGAMSARMLLIEPICVAALLLAAGVVPSGVRKQQAEPLFWAALTIFLIAVIAGLIPPIWRLPGLALVQFPWRALLLVEFTAITLLAMSAPPLRSPPILAAAAALASAYMVLGLIGGHMIGRTFASGSRTAAEIRSDYEDAPEYLPAGTRIVQGEGPDDVHVMLPRLRAARTADPRARIATKDIGGGGMAISIDTPVPTRVSLPRFYFPSWQIYDASGQHVAVMDDANGKLVSFRAPTGRSAFRLEIGPAPYELLARDISLAACILLVAVTLLALSKTDSRRHV